ncbi:hypothetical protein C7Y47_23595 [Lysinibacillus sphaericus]|uniref:Uncharacterized protein n=1 Tax=Lysinibacillus sphaericus TaxID=1421 RepID=A0A544U7P3_LYSSH|nr:hypothetical protein [Lysinibacillus sp. SDF0037]TQR27203.1 hypothetical protein C7Y47_23595 [Lysinibacillus sp. SDF0037]
MKKIKIFTMLTVLLITSLGLFSVENAHAVSSGSQTKGGITAKVYTDKNSYKSNETIYATGEKTAAGGTVYYDIRIWKKTSNGWEQVGIEYGSTSGKTSQVKFKPGVGTYTVMFKIFTDSKMDNWVGDWETTEFKVTN